MHVGLQIFHREDGLGRRHAAVDDGRKLGVSERSDDYKHSFCSPADDVGLLHQSLSLLSRRRSNLYSFEFILNPLNQRSCPLVDLADDEGGGLDSREELQDETSVVVGLRPGTQDDKESRAWFGEKLSREGRCGTVGIRRGKTRLYSFRSSAFHSRCSQTCELGGVNDGSAQSSRLVEEEGCGGQSRDRAARLWYSDYLGIRRISDRLFQTQRANLLTLIAVADSCEGCRGEWISEMRGVVGSRSAAGYELTPGAVVSLEGM